MNPQLNNRLKVFTRLDASNNRIPGSSVERKVMPKVGKWVEDVPFNSCCFPYTEITDETPNDSYSDESLILTVSCDASAVITITTLALTLADINAIVDYLNANMAYLGEFSTDGTTITLKLKQEIADSLCGGTLTLSVRD